MSLIGAKRALLGRSRGNLLAWDSFTRADGAIGRTEPRRSARSQPWTGATWTISTNKAINTPAISTDRTVDGGLEANYTTGLCDTLGKNGSPTVAESADVHGGTKAQSFIGQAISNRILFTPAPSPAVGTWVLLTEWAKRTVTVGSSTSLAIWTGAAAERGPTITAAGYTKYAQATLIRGASPDFGLARNYSAAPDDTVIVDDYTMGDLTLVDLFSSLSNNNRPSVLASVSFTMYATGVTPGGLVTNLDDAATPANFLVTYHNGTNAVLEKCVGGTYTILISEAATYGAGYVLQLQTDRDGADLKANLTYNAAAVGTEQTISDAGIIDNTIHGMFSTYEGNALDNYTLSNV